MNKFVVLFFVFLLIFSVSVFSMNKAGVKSFDEAVVILDKHGVESTAELSESLGKIVSKSSVDAGDKVVKVAVESTIKSADDVVKQTSEAVELGVLNPLKVSPDKGAQYMKAWNGNPLTAEAGEHQLVKMYNSPQTVTKVGVQNIEEIEKTAVLKKGVLEEWGNDHIFNYIRQGGLTRSQQITQKFPSLANNDAVRNAMEEILESGTKRIGAKGEDIIKKPFTNDQGQRQYLEVVMSKDSLGSVQTMQIGDVIG